jgi:hypothetical protein
MFLDTSHNSLPTVLTNIHSAFKESATKMWTYARCLPVGKQPGTQLLIKTTRDLIELAFLLMKSKARNARNKGYACAVSKVQVEWLAVNAFRDVLVRKQTKYREVLEWIRERIEVLQAEESTACQRMKGVVGRVVAID